MAKTKISEWSSTPANNTDIDSINIAEGCAPSGINDAIREMMSQVKDLYSGTTGDAISIAGGGTGQTTATAAFNALAPSQTSNSGKYLTTDGTNSSWATVATTSAATPTALGTVYGNTPSTSGRTFIGYEVAPNAPTYTTAVGNQAAYNVTATNGSYGGAYFGQKAGYSGTTGTDNCFIGHWSGNATTTGSNNSAVGAGSLFSNTTGANNVAVGWESLKSNTTASNNAAVGYRALYANTTGYSNVAVGSAALSSVTTGAANVAVGTDALLSNTADSNTAVGHYAMRGNSTGSYSAAIGQQALYAQTTGGYNTSVGFQAGYSITTGISNTIVGCYTASSVLTTGSRNTYMGYGVTPSSSGVTDEIVIAGGGGGTGKGSSTGFINPATGGVYQGNNSATWSITSDQRLKKNIVDNNVGLDAINAIRVRNFEYRLPEEVTELPQDQAIKKTGIQLGAIAQELQAVLPDCVKTESTGVMSVNSDNLTWYLINAVKELSARVKQLEGN